jgi:prepilin-type N-terminal cleavage/methylation domain-containing protein
MKFQGGNIHMSFFNKKRHSKAFTLVELLVVIAIIGILFIVLVSSVDFANDKAKASGVQTDFRSFQVAIEQVAKEYDGLATLGWDIGDANGNKIRDSVDIGDTNKNGIQDNDETFVGRKKYIETWKEVYTLDNPLDATDKSAYVALETAINANLDPKLHITIDPTTYKITMANGYQDPWGKEYEGYYLSNARFDGMDRGAIVMYSAGANNVFGLQQAISGGIISITNPGNSTLGQDDYAMATAYTLKDGQGAVSTGHIGFGTDALESGSIVSPDAPVEQEMDYYLVGYINGADYGFHDFDENLDANLGTYKFVNKRLVVKFEQNSYVFIKAGNNDRYYTSNYTTDKQATFYYYEKNCYGEKMFIPGGVEVTFTIHVNEANNSINLAANYTYVTPGPTYTVFGVEELCGSHWSPTDTNNDLTKDPITGKLTKVYTGVPYGYYELKVCENHSDAVTYGKNGDNYPVWVTDDNATVTVTFDPNTGEVRVDISGNEVHFTVAGNSTSVFGNPAWDQTNTNNDLYFDSEEGVWIKKYYNVPAVTYAFKICKNYSWDENYGEGGFNGSDKHFSVLIINQL